MERRPDLDLGGAAVDRSFEVVHRVLDVNDGSSNGGDLDVELDHTSGREHRGRIAQIDPPGAKRVGEGEVDALLLGQELSGMASVLTLGGASNGPGPSTR